MCVRAGFRLAYPYQMGSHFGFSPFVKVLVSLSFSDFSMVLDNQMNHVKANRFVTESSWLYNYSKCITAQ